MFWFLAACSDTAPESVVTNSDEDPPELTLPELVGDVDDGDDAFFLYCGTCHGPLARGGIGPDLALRTPSLDDLELYSVIVEGRLPRMPPLRMTDQEAVDIIAWLRDQFP